MWNVGRGRGPTSLVDTGQEANLWKLPGIRIRTVAGSARGGGHLVFTSPFYYSHPCAICITRAGSSFLAPRSFDPPAAAAPSSLAIARAKRPRRKPRCIAVTSNAYGNRATARGANFGVPTRVFGWKLGAEKLSEAATVGGAAA